jgi:hypothetical protein
VGPAGLLLALASLTLPADSPQPSTDAALRSEIEAWRAARVQRLTAEDGWLSVVGLFWLENGDNGVGSAKQNHVALPSSVASRLATIRISDGRATLVPAPGATLTADGQPVSGEIVLTSDADGRATALRSGTVLFYLISRGGRLGVRVKDSASEARRNFHGIESFPVSPAWRIEARFEPYDPPRPISVPNVLGKDTAESSPGALVFERDGRTLRLDTVLEDGETDYFVIFADKTNGTETYGAGRFLYVKPPAGGKTVLDFNKAYNPPCVFTDYATCPLPPPQNRLPIRQTRCPTSLPRPLRWSRT